MKVYIVIELHKEGVPRIIGAYASKNTAERVAAENPKVWRNVKECEIVKEG